MQKQLTQIEFKIADKVYHFTCDPDSPLEHVKEALFQFGKYVGAVEDVIRAQQAKVAESQCDIQHIDQPQVEAA